MPSLKKALREKLFQLGQLYRSGLLKSLLPLTFALKWQGESYTLRDHYMFTPMFALQRPKRMFFKCARQVGKSLSTVASDFLLSLCVDYFSTLFVCPRFEQIKRLSNNYMRRVIRDSPLHAMLVNRSVEQTVLQRSFANGSIQYFSFAFLDAERIRQIPADRVVLDEIQDINFDFLPVIAQTMAASWEYGFYNFTGTPKSFENTAERLWENTSQAEWATKCEACNTWNIACLSEHLLKMIGKTTCICAKCGKPVNPRTGLWVHRHPELRNTFSGYHIPQVVHPYHCEHPHMWQELLYNQHEYPESKFKNECLGESWDSAVKLLTREDLQKASKGGPNDLRVALKRARACNLVVMGIDWGGGGSESESYTAVAIAGLMPGSDRIEILYATKLSRNLLVPQELQQILELVKKFNPILIAHDYGGAGELREVLLVQAGLQSKRFAPFTYAVTSDKHIITYNQPSKGRRLSYTIYKPRSLLVFCTMMKAGKILLPQWESSNEVTRDCLNIMQEVQERPRGSDIMLIRRIEGKPDDFIHAANFACSAIWFSQNRYPDISHAMQIQLTQEDLERINPKRPDWGSSKY